MITCIKIVVFVLGMSISVQVVAAWYRILDLWYTIDTAYLKVIRGILGWSGLSVLIAVLLGNQLRDSFLWGMGSFVLFYVFHLILLQTLIKYTS